MKRINLFYLCVAFVSILGLYASCSSAGGASTDKQPPKVEHNIAVTDGGNSLTLTVIATDPSGIESYTTPRLELGLVNPDGTTKYIRVPLRTVSDAESTWMYNITNDDIGKKVRYRNISATDTNDNESDLFSNLNTGVLAGLGHKMTVLDSNGIETPNQTIANKDDTIKLTIMAATFENTSYTYAASIKIAENIIATDPPTSTDPLNEFTYTIKEGEVGAITYTASVAPTARDEISIVTDHPSRIVVPDQIMPEFTTPTLTASVNPAKVNDTLTLTVTARDAGGLASATATVRVGDRWTFPMETIDVPSEDGVTTDFSFVFVNTVGVRTPSGDVSYSVSVTDIAGNTTSSNWVTSTGISVNPDAILTHSIVGLDPTVADVNKTAVKEGDIIRLRAKVDESIAEAVTFTASLKIGVTPKDFVKKPDLVDGWTVFEYTVKDGENGAVTYSLEATTTAAGETIGDSIIDRESGITVDTTPPTVPSVTLRKIGSSGYGTFAKAGDIIELEITSPDTVTYAATMTVISLEVTTVQQQTNKHIFRYTVGSENGDVGYSVTITDSAGNATTTSNATPTTYVVDTTLPSVASGFVVYPHPSDSVLNEGDLLTLNVTGSDGSNGNAVDIEGQIRIGTATVDATENPSGTFTYTVQGEDNGIVSYTVSVTDRAGNSAVVDVPTGFVRYLYVRTSGDLIDLAALVATGDSFEGKVVVMGNDIGFAGVTNFAGIGYLADNPFSGTFDGGKYKISGLTLSTASTNPIGFFGSIDGATIKNLTIESGTVTGRMNVGGVVGSAVNSTITGVRTGAALTVNINGTEKKANIGGIIGSARNTEITYVHNAATVTGTAATAGIIGTVLDETTLKYAYNTGPVNSISTYTNNGHGEIGGVIGNLEGNGNVVSEVYNIGRLRANSYVTKLGGIVGIVDSTNATTTISNVFNDIPIAWEVTNNTLGKSGNGQIIAKINEVGGSVFPSLNLTDAYYDATGKLMPNDAPASTSRYEVTGIGTIPANTVYTTTAFNTAANADSITATNLITTVFASDASTRWDGSTGTYPTLEYFSEW